MKDLFKLGEKLKHLRHVHKYKQEGVADDLGVASSTYSDYERGVIGVPSSVVVKAAELYKVDLSYFYTKEGPVQMPGSNQASNGSVEQQQGMPQAVMEKLMARYEAMNDRLLALLERNGKKM